MSTFHHSLLAQECLATLQKGLRLVADGYSDVVTVKELVRLCRKISQAKKGFFLPLEKVSVSAPSEFWILRSESSIDALRRYAENYRAPLFLGDAQRAADFFGADPSPETFRSVLVLPISTAGRPLGIAVLEGAVEPDATLTDLLSVLAQMLAWYIVQSQQKGHSASYFVDLNQYPKAHDHSESSDVTLRRSIIQKRYASIISISREMYKIIKEIDKLAAADSNVLLEGESGTGKELIATTIHFNSHRKNNAFVPVNCSAIPYELFESEFFGHLKGSFTGAIGDQKGLFEVADGGTLFLDEIGELPLTMQAKLLRALEEREIRPVGSERSIKVDVRLISATNRNLKEMVNQKTFRQDLFYRINTFSLHIPPLRHRKEDIPLLVDHFLKQISQRTGIPVKKVSREGVRKLIDYDWPGNIRELFNSLERSALMAPDLILPEHIEIGARLENSEPRISLSSVPSGRPINEVIEEIERAMIEEALKVFRGNKQAVAKRLGIDRKTLYRKMRHYELMPKSEVEGA